MDSTFDEGQDIVFDSRIENLASTKNPTLNEQSKKQSCIEITKGDYSN